MRRTGPQGRGRAVPPARQGLGLAPRPGAPGQPGPCPLQDGLTRPPPTAVPTPSLPAPRAPHGSATQLPVRRPLGVQVPPTPRWSPGSPSRPVCVAPALGTWDGCPSWGLEPCCCPCRSRRGPEVSPPCLGALWGAPWHLHSATAPHPSLRGAVGTPAGLTPGQGGREHRCPGVWEDGSWGISPQHGLRTGLAGRQALGILGLLAAQSQRRGQGWGEAQPGPGGGVLPAPTHRGRGGAAGGWLGLGGVRGPCVHQPGCCSVAWRVGAVGPSGPAWGARGHVQGRAERGCGRPPGLAP